MSEPLRITLTTIAIAFGCTLAFWTAIFLFRRWKQGEPPAPDTTPQDTFERRAVAMGEILRGLGWKVLEIEYPAGRFLYRAEPLVDGLEQRRGAQAFSLN